MSIYPEPTKVAVAFCRLLRIDLTAAEMAEVVSRNEAHDLKGDTNICASHDFCDANMVMDEAMRSSGVNMEWGEEGMPEEISTLWNAAWSLAKAAGFDPDKVA